MDASSLIHMLDRPNLVQRLVDHLNDHPEDIIDAKRLLWRFQVSPHEFYQALLSLDHQSTPQPTFRH